MCCLRHTYVAPAIRGGSQSTVGDCSVSGGGGVEGVGGGGEGGGVGEEGDYCVFG